MAKQQGEVWYSKEGGRVAVELIVPHNTKLVDVLKAQETISRELLPKLTPRGCQTCISGADLRIRERLEEIIQVDLQSGKFVQ